MKKLIPCSALPVVALFFGVFVNAQVLGDTGEAGLVGSATSKGSPCEDRCLRTRWCLDDYCPKRMPCIRPPKYCGCCDDYCPKGMPCLRPPKYCGCCDDYCPKGEPCLKIPCWFPSYFRCPPPKCCVSPKTSGQK